MYTDGMIWGQMLQLRVFTPQMVLDVLNPPRYLKSWLKERIRTLIANQVKYGLLRQAVENPPVFATTWATEEDIRKLYKKCVVCGAEFIPEQQKQIVCSQECKRRYYKNWHRKRREEAGMDVDSKRRWTAEEIRKVKHLIHIQAEKGEYERLAKQLNRKPRAIREFVKKLRRRAKYET
ncbi:MAG: DUF2116 family Zn-ribbon domain-containing protein [Desulfurococcaceae archaeon]